MPVQDSYGMTSDCFAELETGLVLPKYILSSSRSGNGWDSKRKAIADGKAGTMSELTDFIKKAGLENPGSLPTNMRGSCSTDLKRKYPEHAVDYWLGHSKDGSSGKLVPE